MVTIVFMWYSGSTASGRAKHSFIWRAFRRANQTIKVQEMKWWSGKWVCVTDNNSSHTGSRITEGPFIPFSFIWVCHMNSSIFFFFYNYYCNLVCRWRKPVKEKKNLTKVTRKRKRGKLAQGNIITQQQRDSNFLQWQKISHSFSRSLWTLTAKSIVWPFLSWGLVEV